MPASLFMHYAPGLWLTGELPLARFERYADDTVIHCVTGYQARTVLAALHERMAGAGLELHPGKTKTVYCKDSNRRGSHEHTSFTFRPRGTRRAGGAQFTSFQPAICKDALKKISAEVRSWRLHRRVSPGGREIARLINPKVRGWMTYYGAFNRAALYPLLRRISTCLLRWIMRKYKKHSTWKKAIKVLGGAAAVKPRYFAHWDWVKPAVR